MAMEGLQCVGCVAGVVFGYGKPASLRSYLSRRGSSKKNQQTTA
jgi:hypothetical protein